MEEVIKTTKHKETEEEFSFKKIFVPLTTLKAIHWIIIIGIVVYFNSLFNGFIGDDYGQLVNNTAVHSLSNIIQFFSNSTFSTGTSIGTANNLSGIYYRPFLSLVYSLLFTFFGGDRKSVV